MVSNEDIGFVHAGQEAEIKIDTFNSPNTAFTVRVRDKPQDVAIYP